MDSKTILSISFTTVFLLSIISAVTAIQTDAMFKIKHLPDFKKTKSEHFETINLDMTAEKIDQSLDTESNISEQSILNKQLKN